MASSTSMFDEFCIAILSIWVFISVASNMSVIACIWTKAKDGKSTGRKSLTSTDILIVSLAVNDIILAGIVLPQKIHDISHTGHFFESNIQCKLVNSLPVMSITAGIYTMVVISIERVRCVLPPRGQQVAMPDTRSIGTRGTIIALFIVWVMSVVIAVPAAVNFDVGVADDEHSNDSNHSLVLCQSTWNSVQTSAYSLFVLAVSYLLPQFALYVNYGRLAAYLWSRRRAVAATSSQPQAVDAGSQSTKQGGGTAAAPIARSTVKTIKMLATIAVLFLASWAPYFTIMTIELMSGYDSSDDKSPENIAMLALAAFSTSYNLPVYLRYNITYRRTFLRMLRCGAAGNDSDNQPSTARPETAVVIARNTATAAGSGTGAADEREATLERGPQTKNAPQPSTSQDHHATVWMGGPNIQELESSDNSAAAQRY